MFNIKRYIEKNSLIKKAIEKNGRKKKLRTKMKDTPKNKHEKKTTLYM